MSQSKTNMPSIQADQEEQSITLAGLQQQVDNLNKQFDEYTDLTNKFNEELTRRLLALAKSMSIEE